MSHDLKRRLALLAAPLVFILVAWLTAAAAPPVVTRCTTPPHLVQRGDTLFAELCFAATGTSVGTVLRP